MQIVVCSRMMEPSKRALRHMWPVVCLGPFTFVSVIFKYLLEAESRHNVSVCRWRSAACHSFVLFPNTRREQASGSEGERGWLVYRTFIAVKIPLCESSALSTNATTLPPAVFKVMRLSLSCTLEASLLSFVFIECISQSAVFADDCTVHPHGVHQTLGSLFTLLALNGSSQNWPRLNVAVWLYSSTVMPASCFKQYDKQAVEQLGLAVSLQKPLSSIFMGLFFPLE